MTTNRISSFDDFVTWKHYPRIRTRRYLALISRLSFSILTPGLLRCTVRRQQILFRCTVHRRAAAVRISNKSTIGHGPPPTFQQQQLQQNPYYPPSSFDNFSIATLSTKQQK
jgi:hypothetical protein